MPLPRSLLSGLLIILTACSSSGTRQQTATKEPSVTTDPVRQNSRRCSVAQLLEKVMRRHLRHVAVRSPGSSMQMTPSGNNGNSSVRLNHFKHRLPEI